MNKSTLVLFNSIQIDNNKELSNKHVVVDDARALSSGLLISPVLKNILDKKTFDLIIDTLGLSGEQMNSAFHKSWSVIKDTPIEKLVLQQIVHYLTTYGFEELGVYSQNTIYIPHEKLNVPEITSDIPLTVVNGLTKDEIYDAIIALGSSVALKAETLEHMMTIIEANMFDVTKMLPAITNKELKSKIYEAYDLVPTDNFEFLRYVVQSITGNSLLIKSKASIAKIKTQSHTATKTLDRLLAVAPKDLAEIFFRYKPIFLALKSISNNKTFFNRLRRNAVKMHKPFKADFLNSLTQEINNNNTIDEKFDAQLDNELAKATVFRKIRLAYSLKFRSSKENDVIVYKIRNGKNYITDVTIANAAKVDNYFGKVLNSIINDLAPTLQNKIVYIPDYIEYALPSSEKMFIGNIPNGSYVKVKGDMIAGIYWKDVKSNRIDLDLSTVSASGKVGWDSNYRTGSGNVLFSGDITAAPHGASEAFYLGKSTEDALMYVNYFNHSSEIPVEAKIFVTQDDKKKFQKDYLVNPNDVLISVSTIITEKQVLLGLLQEIDNEKRLYFTNMSLGEAISSRNSDMSEKARKYLVNVLTNSITLKDVLVLAGAQVVHEKPTDKTTEYVDLSPENLTKTTLINLMQGVI